MKRIYLDYAASTPVDPGVARAMEPYFSKRFGNPGSLHAFGQEAIAAVDSGREAIADAMHAGFREVIFTGSATEANNLVLRGVTQTAMRKGLKNPKIVISAIEHESVLEVAKYLEADGVEVVRLPVDGGGFVDPEKLKSVLDARTALVSVMYANNEIGAIEPISALRNVVHAFRRDKNSPYPLFHADAVQAFQFLDCDVSILGLDFMTISAHKIYGPKGVGALYIRETAKKYIQPTILGGGQEYGFRSGTENVPLIVGFARAVKLAREKRGERGTKIKKLKEFLWKEIRKIYPKAVQNVDLKNTAYVPNILNIYFPGHTSEDLLIQLDLAGIAVSAGSACSSRSNQPSYVLRALGYPPERTKSSIRFSLGAGTTLAEIRETSKILKKILKKR